MQKSFVRWWIHRIASSEHYSDGLKTIQREWTTGDVAEAHRVLDYFDEIAAIQRRRVENEANG